MSCIFHTRVRKKKHLCSRFNILSSLKNDRHPQQEITVSTTETLIHLTLKKLLLTPEQPILAESKAIYRYLFVMAITMRYYYPQLYQVQSFQHFFGDIDNTV